MITLVFSLTAFFIIINNFKLKHSLKILTCCIFYSTFFAAISSAQVNTKLLTIVIIRHGEKPKIGDNLNCQGLNRSRLLPAVIVKKFGVPDFSYVPSVSSDSSTKHARMLQTITPLAAKYNLTINSKYTGKDSSGLVADIMKRNGTVLVVWDHKSILPIIHALNINDASLKWNDDDFDSIWIITFQYGKPVLKKDREGLKPKLNCD